MVSCTLSSHIVNPVPLQKIRNKVEIEPFMWVRNIKMSTTDDSNRCHRASLVAALHLFIFRILDQRNNPTVFINNIRELSIMFPYWVQLSNERLFILAQDLKKDPFTED